MVFYDFTLIFKRRLNIPVFKKLEYLSFVKKACLFIIFCFSVFYTNAHEVRPAYLEINQTAKTDYEILWKIPVLDTRAPKISPVFPENFELKQSSEEFLIDAHIRKYQATFKEDLNGKEIFIEGLSTTLVDVLVQINLSESVSYTILLQPDNPKAIIPVEPNKWEVTKLYIKLGIEHILIGIDHLLFVLGLLLLVRDLGTLIKTITAFTIAHSITLGIAALDIFRMPQAPVEAVIALSILFLAREYLSLKNGKESLTAKHPWVVAFAFGLLHGFGFAGALAEIGLPQKEVPMALFTFNVGVEIGQLIFIAAMILVGKIISLIKIPMPSWSWKVLPYLMGIIASFWLIERTLGF